MSSNEKKVSFFKRIINFFKETRGELKKVTWPTKSQVINNTFVVIIFVLCVGACIWTLDFLMANIIRFIFNKV